MPPPSNSDAREAEPIGGLLIAEGVLTPAQVEQILHHQAQHSGRFCSTALSLGLAEEWALVEVLGRQRGAPGVCPADLARLSDDLFPEGISERFYAAPARALRQTLYVLMRDPDDGAALEAIGAQTRRRLAPLTILESSLRLELARRAEAPLGVEVPVAALPHELGPRRLYYSGRAAAFAERLAALRPDLRLIQSEGEGSIKRAESSAGAAQITLLGAQLEGLLEPHPHKILIYERALPESLLWDLRAREDVLALLPAGLSDEALLAALAPALGEASDEPMGLRQARALHQEARRVEGARQPWAALARYEAALRAHPEHLPSLHDGARLAESLKLKGRAVALWRQALALTPRPALAEEIRARIIRLL